MVLACECEDAVHTGKVTLRDYDPQQPALQLESSVAGAQPEESYAISRASTRFWTTVSATPGSSSRRRRRGSRSSAVPVPAARFRAATGSTSRSTTARTRISHTCSSRCGIRRAPATTDPGSRRRSTTRTTFSRSPTRFHTGRCRWRPSRGSGEPRPRWSSASRARRSGPTSTAGSRCSSTGTAWARRTRTARAGCGCRAPGRARGGVEYTSRASARK